MNTAQPMHSDHPAFNSSQAILSTNSSLNELNNDNPSQPQNDNVSMSVFNGNNQQNNNNMNKNKLDQNKLRQHQLNTVNTAQSMHSGHHNHICW